MGYPVFHVPAGDVLPVMFDTFAGATGASITMTGLAVTDIEIYKDGGTTQRASDSGYVLLDTDGIDFDGITGVHGFSIDTGDNGDAGFYTVGAWFTVVVSSVTVDGQTVSFIACQFRLMAAEGVAAKPKADVDAWSGTAVSAPATAGIPEVNLKNIANAAVSTSTAQLGVNAVQAGGTAWASGAITAASIATGAIDADALASDAVDEIWAKAMSDLAAVPGATASALAALNWLFELARNKITQTASLGTLMKDDGSTPVATSAVSDDATTVTRGEWA